MRVECKRQLIHRRVSPRAGLLLARPLVGDQGNLQSHISLKAPQPRGWSRRSRRNGFLLFRSPPPALSRVGRGSDALRPSRVRERE